MLAAAAGTAATASWDANVCGADFFVKPLVHTRTPHEGEEGKRRAKGQREGGGKGGEQEHFTRFTLLMAGMKALQIVDRLTDVVNTSHS